MRVSHHDIVPKGFGSSGYGRDHHIRIPSLRAVVTGEFTERRLGLSFAARDKALDHDIGVCRNEKSSPRVSDPTSRIGSPAKPPPTAKWLTLTGMRFWQPRITSGWCPTHIATGVSFPWASF